MTFYHNTLMLLFTTMSKQLDDETNTSALFLYQLQNDSVGEWICNVINVVEVIFSPGNR